MSHTPRLLICMMGLPRSGKSTVARALSSVWHAPLVNRDSIRLALHGERYLKPAEPMVRVFAKLMVESLFTAGHQIVIIDETNMKRSTRDYWREGEWGTRFLLVDTSFSECVLRANKAKDDKIRPVIVRMHDYTEPLAEDEEKYNIQSGAVSKVFATSTSEGLGIVVGT